MPSRCYYVSSTGERVSLDGPGVYIGVAEQLRSREWTYTLGWRTAINTSRDAREAVVTASFPDMAQADRLRRLADADVYRSTPGRVEVDGEWTQAAYIVKSEVGKVSRGFMQADVTILLLDGVWRRRRSRQFSPKPSSGGGGVGKGFPHGYPYGYGAAESAAGYVDFGDIATPSPLRITVYGPASNPEVSIGGNVYSLLFDVPSGGYAVVDGLEATVELVTEGGDRSNRLALAERGSGEGSGRYIFQRVEPGLQQLSWDGSFGFDLEWYDEEGEPPWSS